MYVHADMSATHENDTTLMGQKWNKKGRCPQMLGRHFPDMSLTCRPTRQCRVKIANADIRQTQLRWKASCSSKASLQHKGHEDHNNDVEPLMNVYEDNDVEVDYEFHNDAAFVQIELGLKETDV